MQNAFHLALSKRMSKKFLKEKIIDFSLFFFIIFKEDKGGFKSRHSIQLKDVFYSCVVCSFGFFRKFYYCVVCMSPLI